MQLATRSLLNRCFTWLCGLSVVLMVAALFMLLGPITFRGVSSVIFRQTSEFDRMEHDLFGRGSEDKVKTEYDRMMSAAAPIFASMKAFEQELDGMPSSQRRELKAEYESFREALSELLGPIPGSESSLLARNKYGQTRWDRALVKFDHFRYVEDWVVSDHSEDGMLVKKRTPRELRFAGTKLESAFNYLDKDRLAEIMQPRLRVYLNFFTDVSHDSHFFGGIWPELWGTLLLTIGAMLFAVPMGIIAAIYLVEYATDNWMISLIRICISTLAGVPSIVFGLFGLSFFINTIKLSESKSVIAGSATLALLILPTIIRASEEAIRSVPNTYREAAIGLGSTRWHAITSVILPASLPGILTGIVISMGRAAGETAPIIFTAAVSVGAAPGILDVAHMPTPALSWNVYNICTEHEAVEEIRHVQYGMVLTLIALVLLLNGTAIVLRARVSRKLKG